MATGNSVSGNLSEFILKKDDWNNYIKQMDFFFFKRMALKKAIKRKLFFLVPVAPMRTSCLKV